MQMSIFDRFKRKKQITTESDRKAFLLQFGRITDGEIVDSEIADNGREFVTYVYSIQGVDFESSEILSEEQMSDPLKYAPGAKVGVRFDPKNHGNSMLA